MTVAHGDLQPGVESGVHVLPRWTRADAAAREAIVVTAADEGGACRQLDTGELFYLRFADPVTWSAAMGTPGPQGPQGIQGERGPQGERGLQGAAGAQGVQGPAGSAGAQGLKGDTGNAGAAGAAGATGAAGASGLGSKVALAAAQTFSTVTHANVAGMSLPVLPNTTYVVRLYGAFQSAALTTGMAVALAIPSGSVVGQAWHPISATASFNACEQIASGTTTNATTGVRAINTNVPLAGEWLVSISATGGNVQLTCRSEINASNIVLQPGLSMFVLAV